MKVSLCNLTKAALLSTLALTTLTACDNSGNSTAHFAYVDLGRVIISSDISSQEKAHLDAVKSALIASAKEAGEVYKTMPDDEKKKAAAADAAILNRDWTAEERKARVASVQAVMKKVEEYRKSHGIQVVMNRTAILAADPKADISTDIIKALSGTSIDYGKLPEIKVKKQDNK